MPHTDRQISSGLSLSRAGSGHGTQNGCVLALPLRAPALRGRGWVTEGQSSQYWMGASRLHGLQKVGADSRALDDSLKSSKNIHTPESSGKRCDSVEKHKWLVDIFH